MKIGIDISQISYKGTGVSNYLQLLIQNLLTQDKENEYIFFYSSLRKKFSMSEVFDQKFSNVQVKQFRFPPGLLDFLWNRIHIFPIEWFIGDIDIFISSDWTQPPTKKAKKMTILYDLIVYKYPAETADLIVRVQKRRLRWVAKEADKIICISEATKADAINILHIDKNRLQVIYPGI